MPPRRRFPPPAVRRILGTVIWGAIFGTIFAIAIPFAKVYCVQRKLTATNEMIETGRAAQALPQLQAIESMTYFHAPAVQEIGCQTITCYAQLDSIADAERWAKWMLEREEPAPEKPTVPRSMVQALEFVTAAPNWLCYRFLMHNRTFTWDKWAGYKALMMALGTNRDRQPFMLMAEKIAQQYPGNPVASVHKVAPPVVGDTRPPTPRPVVSRPAPPQHAVVPAPPPNAVWAGLDLYWGIVKTPKASVYNSRGDRFTQLDAGALVDILDIKTIGSNEVAECAFDYDRAHVSGMFIKTSNLEIRPGPLDEASAQEKDLRTRKARISAEIAQCKGDPSSTFPNGDPRAARYEAARAKYDQFREEGKKAQAEMDKSTGARRNQLSDKLRKMKYEEVTIRQELQAAAKALQSAAPSQNNGKNSRLADLKRQLAEVERDLGQFEVKR